MPITPTVIHTSSLVSPVIGTSSCTKSKSEFDEDIVIYLGDYFYIKFDKAVVKNGKKRSKDQGGMEASLTNQIVWTQQSSDP